MTNGAMTLIGGLCTYSVPCGKDIGDLEPGDIVMINEESCKVIFYADERNPQKLRSRPPTSVGQQFISDKVNGLHRVMVVTKP